MKRAVLPLRCLKAHKGASAALILLSALLAFTLFAGSVTLMSLNRGLESLENRLGADIIVLPKSARSKVNVRELFLQGTTGYYYMSADKLEAIRAIEGVEKASGQIFLASLRADCCSVAVQVIGFDPETDFTVQPWISQRLNKSLGYNEVVVGSKVNADVGEYIRIYGVNCAVAARLDATGSDLDTAVYCTWDTMTGLLNAASEMGHELKITGDPSRQVSAVYVKLDRNADPTQVLQSVTHISGVAAAPGKDAFSDIAGSLNGVARAVGALIAALWALSLLLLLAAFTLQGNGRRSEYAALRVMGFSRSMLAGEALKEALLAALAGGIIGVCLGALTVVPFSGLIEAALDLPFLLPGAGRMTMLGLISIAAVCVSGPLAAVVSAVRLSRTDTGALMREG